MRLLAGVAAFLATLLVAAAPANLLAQAPTATPTHAHHTHACPAGVAFCEQFPAPHPGGRGGDLDEARWSVSRVQTAVSVYEGNLNRWSQTMLNKCGTPTLVMVPNDFAVCNGHYMEAFDDQRTGYVYNSARPRQQFDFAGRTGTIAFEVDAKMAPHGWWPEVWLTDEPVPAPHASHGGAHPKNGIGVAFTDCQAEGEVGAEFFVVRNYLVETSAIHHHETCLRTQDNVRNLVELRVNANKVELWASHHDDGAHTLHRISWTDGFVAPLTRGYVHFQHSQYRAADFGFSQQQTYHWGRVWFDGPVLPARRGYDVANSMSVPPFDPTTTDRNLGWLLKEQGLFDTGTCCYDPAVPITLQVPGVDLAGATEARLNINLWNFHASSDAVSYRLNSGTWRTVTSPSAGSRVHALSIVVPLTDLVAGNNALQLRAKAGSEYIVANVDIELAVPAQAPTATVTSTRTATPTPQIVATPTPTPQAVATVECSVARFEGGRMFCTPLG